MSLLYSADNYVARWVEERIPRVRFEKYSAIGVMHGSRLVAGVVYHNYYPEYANIEMSVAADTPRWATKRALKALFAYPFHQLKCNRITATVKATNSRAFRFNVGLGFRQEGLVRKGYGEEDMVVMGLLKEEATKIIGVF